jgi:hypothetical protein
MSTVDAMSTPTADEIQRIRARYQRQIEQLERYRHPIDADGHGVFTQYGYLDEEGNECWAATPFDHLRAGTERVMIMRTWTCSKTIPVACLES